MNDKVRELSRMLKEAKAEDSLQKTKYPFDEHFRLDKESFNVVATYAREHRVNKSQAYRDILNEGIISLGLSDKTKQNKVIPTSKTKTANQKLDELFSTS